MDVIIGLIAVLIFVAVLALRALCVERESESVNVQSVYVSRSGRKCDTL